METLERSFPNYKPMAFSPAASFSSSQGDLLADLWLEPQYLAPSSTLSGPVWPAKHAGAACCSPTHKLSGPTPGVAGAGAGCEALLVLRDASLEYAQLLLPHLLLAPLTEENLGYNSDIFNFEQQQAQQAAPKKGRRQGLVLLLSLGKSLKHVNTQLYKTELCVLYMKMGVCPYAAKCQFAHGEGELKRVDRPANWRSKPCANWARYGLCRYGKRCCFKHG